MKINSFSITFWFNIFTNHEEILKILSEDFKEEFTNFNFLEKETDNLLVPVITAINREKMTNFTFSKINFQYNMDKVEWTNFNEFKEHALQIFDTLTNNQVDILHTAIFINGEIISEESLKMITEKTLNPQIVSNDLVDATLKLGKKHEDLFYKIVTLLNKRQIKLPKEIDKNGNLVPIPLISWNGAFVENELVDISYEINDKYSFDFTKNYHTTTFHLNKMLYILENDMQSDIDGIIKKGEF